MTDERTAEQQRLDTEWVRLHETEADLRTAMRKATSDSERVELTRRLGDTRRAIAQMEAAASGHTGTTSTVADPGTFGDEDISDFLNTLLTDEEAPTSTSNTRSHPRPAPPMLWVLAGLTLALGFAYVASLLFIERPEDGYLTIWDGWVLHLAMIAPATLSAYRALTDRRGRAAWWLVTAGITLFTIASLVFTYRDQNLDPVPFPGWSDVLYLESQLALLVALGLVTHLHVGSVSRSARLNGVVIGLAAAAVAVTLWFESILEQSGSTAAVLVGLAYPVSDLVFIAIAMSGLSLVRYRPSPSVAAFVAGAVLWAVGDVIFLRQIAEDTYVQGTILEATWLFGLIFFGIACWLPSRSHTPTPEGALSLGVAFVPWIAAIAALAVIGWSIDHDVPSLGVWLAMASLVMVMVRIGLALNELRQANEQFSEGWIGEVAGFRERPRVEPDMTSPIAATASQQPSVWMAVFGAMATAAFVGVGVLLWQVASNQAQTSSTDEDGAVAAVDEAEATDGQAVPVETTEGVDPATPTTVQDFAAAVEADLRSQSLQRELDRVFAFTPIVFDSGQQELTANHERILNNVAAVLLTSPGIPVTVVGYTDDTGSAQSNLEVSEARANAVRDYLIGQGVPEADLVADGRGNAIASGTPDQSGLERRVDFEVRTAPIGDPVATSGPWQLGVVASSAGNDLAFTQSMVDSLNVLAAESEGSTVTVVDNTLLAEDAAAALRDMAQQGFDLVIAHDPRLGTEIPEIAAEFPDVTFAWGPTAQVPTQPNVYTYTVAAEEGGYVLGAVAANLTTSGVVGIVGPIEAGDAQRYVAGFEAGVDAEQRGVTHLTTYTGSFLDASLAASAAADHLAAGADVVTGVGPVAASAGQATVQGDAVWIGNYVDQAGIDPGSVVASQVYHWDVPLREILNDRAEGGSGRTVTGTLQNGGVSVLFNSAYALDPELVAKADELIAAISDGSITPPID